MDYTAEELILILTYIWIISVFAIIVSLKSCNSSELTTVYFTYITHSERTIPGYIGDF